jgi:[ribosomal protein S18]-alanine N-acetyltransferase
MGSLIVVTRKNLGLFQEAILAIERASFPSPWSPQAFRAETENVISSLWTWVSGGHVAAYICFWRFAGEIHLLNLAVHPSQRRKGIGRYLLSRMCETAIRNGVRDMQLEVRPSNAAARALYEKAGFREVGRRPRYYDDTREDAILMTLAIAGPSPRGA